MIIPIKIQCGCGQRYAFDFEADGQQMPGPVVCPVCGLDGTAAANQCIAESLPLPASAAGASAPVRVAGMQPSVRLASPAASTADFMPRTSSLLPGQVDRTQAETEARANIFWGDPPEEVVKFLMRQGFGVREAKELVAGMFLERAKTIRRNGVKKVIAGALMMCVPVIFFLVFNGVGYLPLKLFAVTIMVGLWGAYMALRGAIMICAPKSEPGDVAEQ